MTKTLNKQAILGYKPAKPTTIHVPELGGDVAIRMMSASDYENAQALQDKRGKDQFDLVPIFIYCVCDEKGERLFDESDAAAVEALPLPVLVRVCRAINKLNGIDDTQEEIKKN